ncbi:MAG: hypothetical protein JWP57_1060 [Spirosoma sp.]|nr:hypothetical protein [Spirosoma sp.]
MRNSAFAFALLLVAFWLTSTGRANAQKQSATAWESLFNGKDLSGWETYLRPSAAAPDQTPIGLNKDPHGVFKAGNGMIHVSGQDWGGIFTKKSYKNYHLRCQVKFGQKKWAPRENAVADGGLLFHGSAPYDFGSTCWMRSVELQIQETDIGDYHNVGAGIPMLQFSKAKDGDDSVDQYDPTAPFQLTKNRVYRSANFESAPNDWTNVELVARGADAVFIVNGFVVNRLFNIYRTDLHQQTTSGQLEFQSEGAEHYLKDIALRPINFYPEGTPKLVANQANMLLSTDKSQVLEVINQGGDTELIAVELIGKDLEQFGLKLPGFPLVLKKGDKLTIPVSIKAGGSPGNQAILQLETVLGPVEDFKVTLRAK